MVVEVCFSGPHPSINVSEATTAASLLMHALLKDSAAQVRTSMPCRARHNPTNSAKITSAHDLKRKRLLLVTLLCPPVSHKVSDPLSPN